jgi:MOSC domain-containing protein YiiM
MRSDLLRGAEYMETRIAAQGCSTFMTRRKTPPSQICARVHLLESELLEHLQTLGFEIMPGQLGENITTRNLRLIDLYAGARVRVGAKSVIEITGLREPCVKIERFKKGLRAAVTARRDAYAYMKSAVMAAVIESGTVYAGDEIDVIDGAGRGIPLSLV